MINPRWCTRVASFIGGFPENYLVFDCETNGLESQSQRTLPVELGWCMVKDRVPAHQGSFLINWGLHPTIDAVWFEQSVRATRMNMLAKGIEKAITWEQIDKEGHDPREVIPHFRDFLAEAQVNDYMYVGHNAYAFDRPIVENATLTATGDMFRFDYRRVLDTGMIFKSMITGFPVPEPGERPVFRWYEDVRGAVRRGKWNLAFCLDTLGLIERHTIDMAGMHGAAQDCRCTHYVLEAFRELAESGASQQGG